MQTLSPSPPLDLSNQGHKRLRGVEILRGVAALCVVLHHAGSILGENRYGGREAFHAVLGEFHLGVDFFFVLSGFIITWVHWGDIGNASRLRSYISRRFTRIYPAYWALLVPLALLYHVFPNSGAPDKRDWINFLGSFLLLPADHEMILGVAWTLTYEVFFYIVFGALIFCGKKLLWLLPVWVAAIFASALGGGHDFWAAFFLSPYNLNFLMGIAAALVLRRGRVPYANWLFGLGGGLFLIAMAGGFARLFLDDPLVVRLTFGFLAAVTLVGVVELERRGRLALWRGMDVFGASSYAMYLVHPVAISLALVLGWRFLQFCPPQLLCLILAVIGVGAGIAFHLRVETPLMAFARKGKPMTANGNEANGEIRPLTGVRGVAAFLVVLYHLHYNAHFTETYLAFAGRFYLLVDLFFILSGFVLALRYHQDFASGLGLRRIGVFMAQRFGRIYPAYFFVSCLYYVRWLLNLTNLRQVDYGPYDIVMNLFLVQGWGLDAGTICPTSWSVSVELLAYLLFPLLICFLALRNNKSGPALLLAAAVAGLAVVAASPYGVNGALDIVDPVSVLPLVRGVSEFCFGLVAFYAVRLSLVKAVFSHVMAVPALLVIAVAVYFSDWSDTAFVAVMPFLIMSLYYNGPVAARLFGNPTVYWLGVISYSVYLLHALCLDIAGYAMVFLKNHGMDLPQILFQTGGIVLTLIAAILTQRYIEEPGRRKVKALLRKHRPRLMASPPLKDV